MKQQLQELNLDEIRDEGAGLAAFRRDLGDLSYLAASIKEHGLLSTPLVWQTGQHSAPFVVLDGRRRLAAIKLLRERWRGEDDFPLQTVTCSIVTVSRYSDIRTLVTQLRLDPAIDLEHNRGDEAVLSEEFRLAEDMKEEELERYLGLSQSVISQSRKYVRDLPREALAQLRAGAITKESADGLLKLAKEKAGPLHADDVAVYLAERGKAKEDAKSKVVGARKRTAAIW